MEKKLAVIALGGNALLRGNQKGTIEEQNANTIDTLENLVYLIKEGYNLIISHGNGPQVGNVLMDNAAGVEKYDNAAMPLDVCVAFTQGQIGYMIERNLRNILKEHGLQRNVISMVSQVIVDKNDPALQNPTKRVGKIYMKDEADKLAQEKGWVFKEEIKVEGGWRRVVPSPDPKDFMNADLVERLAREGNIVITTGGGGIPVYIDEKGDIQPIEGVIDKDLASAMVGTRVKEGAEVLKQEVAQECEIGNHTWDHANLAKLSMKKVNMQYDKTADLVKKLVGYDITLLRPPYGAISAKMRKKLKHPMVLWNTDTLDWKSKNTKAIMKEIKKNVKDGDIILMHDIHPTTVEALKKVLPWLVKNDYDILTVSELAKRKGAVMHDGKAYGGFTGN